MSDAVFSVTILADNTAAEPFAAEHGFSAFLAHSGAQAGALFDVGRGALLANAEAAGIDLASVADIVLSHGHYDHTDALSTVLERAPSARIHASAGILDGHWSARTGTLRPIGVSEENRSALAGPFAANFQPFRGETSFSPTQLAVNAGESPAAAGNQTHGRFHLTEDIPRFHPLETPSPLLFADAGGFVPDPVSDELALWAETPEGLVILTGCCHAGLINTCERVRTVSGIGTIRAVIGGFHLAGVSEERLTVTADYVRDNGIKLLVPCHCTGQAETDWLRVRLGETVEPGACGMKFEF